MDDLTAAVREHSTRERKVVEGRVDRGADADLGDRRPRDLLDRHHVVGVLRLGDQRPQLGEVDLDPVVVVGALAGRDVREVVLATNDNDLYQLVGPCVKVYTTAKADLVSPKDAFALLGEAEVTTKWGVPPKLIGDVLALSGDSVDNIPSAGFGRKTAAKLLMEHGNLDSVLANLETIKSERTREKLIAGRTQIEQNRKMVELDCDTQLPVPIDELRIKPDYPALIAALEKCEFKSLLQEVRDEAAQTGTVKQAELLL